MPVSATRTRAGGIQTRLRRQSFFNELARVDRTNTSPDDSQEILPKKIVRAGQFKCLGSDQADKPVTTSNFLRSELTNWGASSWVESCSS
jgi:hypothetical protein